MMIDKLTEFGDTVHALNEFDIGKVLFTTRDGDDVRINNVYSKGHRWGAPDSDVIEFKFTDVNNYVWYLHLTPWQVTNLADLFRQINANKVTGVVDELIKLSALGERAIANPNDPKVMAEVAHELIENFVKSLKGANG